MKNLYSGVSNCILLLLIQRTTLRRWLVPSQVAHYLQEETPSLFLYYFLSIANCKRTVTTVRRGQWRGPHKPNALHNVPSSTEHVSLLAITGVSLQAIMPLRLRHRYGEGVNCPSFHNPIFLDRFSDCAKGTLHFRILLGVKALCALAH